MRCLYRSDVHLLAELSELTMAGVCMWQAMMEQMSLKLNELDSQLAIKNQTITQLQ